MWLLSARTAHQFLLNFPVPFSGTLLTNKDIGMGKFSVSEVFKESRNAVFFVKINNENYFLKQPKNIELEFTKTILNEAKFHKCIKFNFIENDYISDFLAIDTERFILIFKADIDYISIKNDEIYKDCFALSFVNTINTLHSRFEKIVKKAKNIPYFKPILLTTFERRKLLITMSNFENKSLRELADSIERIEPVLDKIEWKYNDTIINRDIKYSNILSNQSFENNYALKIIDWELASLGDRLWDIATYFYPYLKSTSNSQANHDFGLEIYSLINSLIAIKDQYTINFPAEKKCLIVKRILQYCAIGILENYIFSILNNRYDSTTEQVEYYRVQNFIELLEKDNADISFYCNYLEKLSNEHKPKFE